MPYIPPRRRRKAANGNSKVKQALIDLVLKLVGETLKAKMARAVAIGAVGGISQYSMAPADPQAPDVPTANVAPAPPRQSGVPVDLKLESK